MNDQDRIEACQEIIDGFNAGDTKRFRTVLADNCFYDEVATQRGCRGADNIVEFWEGWRKAMSNINGTVTNTMTCGNNVVFEVNWKGTLDGEFTGPTGTIKPTGKTQMTRACLVFTTDGDNKIAECKHFFDMFGFMQQVGALPTTTT